MREWSLTPSDPFTLRLAADVRLGPTDYADDHIWELNLAGGEPPAVALRTTYGLRARDMRIFPAFADGDRVVTDPGEFASAPVIRAFFVNYIRLTFEPIVGLRVTAEYWAPHSHAVAGQFTLTNNSADSRRVHVLLSALLKPLENPKNIGPIPWEEPDPLAVYLLEGHTGNLDIAVLLEGASEVTPAPHPTISRAFDLAPGETATARWVEAACPPSPSGDRPDGVAQQAGLQSSKSSAVGEGATSPSYADGEGRGGVSSPAATSLDLIRALLHPDREWEGEFARIELLNAGLLDIETGDEAWDAAFAFAQVVALRCYVGPTAHLPHPSFVFARHPDRGYSRSGDGSDHDWMWNGQVATEAYVNLPQIVPAAPDLAKGILRNWLAIQAEDGTIDWKPGLAGQREKALCIPLLGVMAWRLYEHTEDREFLAEVYPGLRRFLDVWFTRRHDRDVDGVPEWSHTIQSAFDDNPSFVRWQRWGQGADITQAEAPDLAAYLYRECQALSRVAALLGMPEDPVLSDRAAEGRRAVEAMWHDATASYHYVDRDSHASTPGEVLATGQGRLAADLQRRFRPAARILVKALGPRDARPEMEVTLVGRGRRGRHRVETLRRSHVQWYFGIGTTSSEKLYSVLERVEIHGLTDDFEVTVSTVDYTRQDQTLLLPLWGGIPDRDRAEALVRRTLMDPERYWRKYGLPNCSAQDPAYRPDKRDGSGGVWMMWNTMLGEGLVEYGYRAEAAELVRRLMAAMLFTLAEEKAFREAYNADRLEGIGERNYLWGVAPVALFMQALGVRLISPRRVYLEGRSPFPWPVTVRWKGVTVVKQSDSATVTFPSGREATVSDPAPQVVEDA